MKPLILTAALALMFAPAVHAATQDAAPRLAEVSVVREGDAFTVDYEFTLDRPAYAFQVSALTREGRRAWRRERWTVQTPGVVLDRIGAYDVLRSIDGQPLPRRIRILMHPAGGDLEAEYSPSLVFSDGAVALFTEQFDLIPLESAQAAADLPRDLNGFDFSFGPTWVTWRDTSGPVLFRGQRAEVASASDAGTYVYFGQGEAVGGSAVAAIFDPGLPTWLVSELSDFTPLVLAFYADRIGPRAGDLPTLMVSWSGPTEGMTSMAGSVLPNLIVMDFQGEGVLDRSRRVLDTGRWFIGHEAGHFWLGSQGLRYAAARDAWITEGGADLMAVRAISSLDSGYNGDPVLQRSVDDCIALVAIGPLAEAGDRGDNRAFYACGAVWALAFEAARRASDGGDWFDILRDFRATQTDGILTRDEWLTAFTQATGDPALRQTIERMLDQGGGDPAADIAAIFQATGVAHRHEGGRVILAD
ncbi:hypothetical protein [Brevundimonas bacteroides]|uniref:hypothetical protein n=1 Tax=Brevundimonas bacteroides TaxID=74311 RepID=UPI0012ED6B92|nr:hypothetical protein [Brevundimonas bacteroides]